MKILKEIASMYVMAICGLLLIAIPMWFFMYVLSVAGYGG